MCHPSILSGLRFEFFSDGGESCRSGILSIDVKGAQLLLLELRLYTSFYRAGPAQVLTNTDHWTIVWRILKPRLLLDFENNIRSTFLTTRKDRSTFLRTREVHSSARKHRHTKFTPISCSSTKRVIYFLINQTTISKTNFQRFTMTAKNKKKNAGSRKEKQMKREEAMKDIPVYDGEKKYSDEEPPTLESAYKPFTTAQLGALIFFIAGASKLYELASALDDTEGQRCLSYLPNDEETCLHPHFKSLLQAKYYSALSLGGLFSIFVLQLWHSEYYFMKFMNCLCFSPLFTSFLAIVALAFTVSPGEDVLAKGKTWEMCIIMTILYGSVAPKSVDHLPFFTSKLEDNVKLVSVQAIALWALIGASIWDVVQLFYTAFSDNIGLQNALLDTPVPLPAAAKALVYFWVVDKIAMAVLYAFAAVHLPVFKQRSILMATLGIKICEYYMQLENMSDPFKNQETFLAPLTMALAVTSGVAWFM